MIETFIFVVPALFANLKFQQPSGSDEEAGAITLRSSRKAAQGANDPTPAALPWMAVCGRAFLAERIKDNRIF
jgi:hypothetical protein